MLISRSFPKQIALLISILLLPYLHLFSQRMLAFPGAEGFGKYTKGGRGGKVFVITNLDDSGPGSFREALETKEPRIVVMGVSGLIDLNEPIRITHPYITIAGHTASDGGVTIRGNKIRVMASEVIIRFLKVRVGDIEFGNENQWEDLDAITIGNKDTPIKNIIIDHCSLSWATDENIGIAYEVSNVTIQNSIISEGLYKNKHPKGVHSMGILVGWQAENISVINNLFLHNNKRHPRLGNSGLVDVRNNIIYNPGYMGINIWNVDGEPQKANIVNNMFYKGPNTKFDREISIWDPPKHKGLLFLKNNIGFEGNKNNNWDMVENEIYPRENVNSTDIERIRTEVEFPHEETRTKSYDEIITFANDYIGASLPMRDLIDLRLLDEFNKRGGKIIDSQEEVGGWIIYDEISQHGNKQTGYNLMDDSNGNGIKDTWSTHYNIQSGEENKDYNLNGYTNIEEYLNGTNPLVYYENQPQEIFNYWKRSFFGEPEFSLAQNFPNPFRDFTKIRFTVQEKSDVKIIIMNSLGQIIDEIVSTNMFPGSYETIWEPGDLPSGTYLMFLKVSDMVKCKKIIHY